MAVHRLLQQSAFAQEDIDRMVGVYEDVLRVLRISNRSDPATEKIARKIIEVAQTGERDPTRIKMRALKALGVMPG